MLTLLLQLSFQGDNLAALLLDMLARYKRGAVGMSENTQAPSPTRSGRNSASGRFRGQPLEHTSPLALCLLDKEENLETLVCMYVSASPVQINLAQEHKAEYPRANSSLGRGTWGIIVSYLTVYSCTVHNLHPLYLAASKYLTVLFA